MSCAGLIMLAAACSTASKDRVIDPATGRHAAGWSGAGTHGAAAKKADGFSSCQECHGSDFSGGMADTACSSCHGVNAPHPPKPWRDSSTYTHTSTDEGNASICALCHTNGANSSVQPSPAAAAGTAPGCFNNTLCHGTVGHAAGWSDPAQHGASAKSQANGFASCQECHGTDFSGGIANTACSSCHGVNAPHPAAPWRDSTYTHTTTNEGNATVCALCHTNGANSSVQPSPAAAARTAPGCFNNTLCHGTVGHAAGWSDPAQHGASAKSQANGFASCQECHGTDFSGGIANTACSSCHGVNAPHPPKPWRDGTYTHTTTNEGNATVCALCHTNGANSSVQPSPPAAAGTAPGCFNSTLCHAQVGHPAGWSDPTQHGVSAEQDFSVCKTCHGSDYQGGTTGTSCYSCHNGPGLDHPAAAWVVADHKTSALADNTVCQKCHGTDYLGGGTHVACKSCHMQDQTKVHLLSWYPDVQRNHSAYAYANGTTSCSNVYCHGTNLTGVSSSGPSCASCHSWPINTSDCASCHGTPPSGTTFPNVAGSHAPHANVNSSVVCGTCHQGAGSGTAYHFNNVVDVILDATYNAKSGTASYNASTYTCSNISCHGGSRTQTSTQAGQNPPQSTPGSTPSWLTGTIDVNSQCTACHVLGSSSGSPENNSYYSGQHRRHVYSEQRACTDCHDTTKLAGSHFTSLTAPISEATASATIKSSVNFNGATCSPSCHGTETW